MDIESDIRLGTAIAEVAVPTRRATATRASRESSATFLLFVAPYFTFWLLFLAVPVLYGFWISFHDWDIVGEPSWVQVTPSGGLIVLHVDHQTSGGYPVIATVTSADLALLAQARPGDTVRFRAVDPAEAARAARRLTDWLHPES